MQDEGSRVLPIVTEGGSHPFTMRWCQLQRLCHKGYRIILDSKPGQSGVLPKHTGEWVGLREEKRCPHVRQLDFSRIDSWQKDIEGLQVDTV